MKLQDCDFLIAACRALNLERPVKTITIRAGGGGPESGTKVHIEYQEFEDRDLTSEEGESLCRVLKFYGKELDYAERHGYSIDDEGRINVSEPHPVGPF
jgi:hypothetical protein